MILRRLSALLFIYIILLITALATPPGVGGYSFQAGSVPPSSFQAGSVPPSSFHIGQTAQIPSAPGSTSQAQSIPVIYRSSSDAQGTSYNQGSSTQTQQAVSSGTHTGNYGSTSSNVVQSGEASGATPIPETINTDSIVIHSKEIIIINGSGNLQVPLRGPETEMPIEKDRELNKLSELLSYEKNVNQDITAQVDDFLSICSKYIEGILKIYKNDQGNGDIILSLIALSIVLMMVIFLEYNSRILKHISIGISRHVIILSIYIIYYIHNLIYLYYTHGSIDLVSLLMQIVYPALLIPITPVLFALFFIILYIEIFLRYRDSKYKLIVLLSTLMLAVYLSFLLINEFNIMYIVDDDWINAILLSLLFVANFHLLFTLRADRQQIIDGCNEEPFERRLIESQLGNQNYILIIIIPFLIALPVVGVYWYDHTYNSFSPFFTIETFEGSTYKVYNEEYLNNTSMFINSIYNPSKEINNSLHYLNISLDNINRTNIAMKKLYNKGHNGNNKQYDYVELITAAGYLENNVSKLHKKILKLQSHQYNQSQTIISFSKVSKISHHNHFPAISILDKLKWFNYSQILELESDNLSDIRKCLNNISVNSSYKSQRLCKLACNLSNEANNSSANNLNKRSKILEDNYTKTSIILKDNYTKLESIFEELNISSQGIDFTINKTHSSMITFNSTWVYPYAVIFDIFAYILNFMLLALFALNLFLTSNIQYWFIMNTRTKGSAQKNELCERVKLNILFLKRMQSHLNAYSIYYLIILALSVLLYLIMKHDEKGDRCLSCYIEVIPISLGILIIIILSCISLRRIQNLVEECLCSSSIEYCKEIIQYASRPMNKNSTSSDDLEFKRAIENKRELKDIEAEFSFKQNIASYLSILAPIISLILAYFGYK